MAKENVKENFFIISIRKTTTQHNELEKRNIMYEFIAL